LRLALFAGILTGLKSAQNAGIFWKLLSKLQAMEQNMEQFFHKKVFKF